MAKVLHRESKVIRESVNTPDFPVKDWIINPDMKNVEGVPVRHWKISGNDIEIMSQAERDIVDALNAEKTKDSILNSFDSDDIPRLISSALISEINLLRAQHGLPLRTVSQLKEYIRSKI